MAKASPITPAHVAPAKTVSSEPYRPGYEVVAEKLLQYISDENFTPGDRLPTEKGLAEILGSTPNVTREAVKVLAAMGRLSVRKGAGIFLAAGPGAIGAEVLTHFQPTAMEQVHMLLEHRRLIEGDSARRAASSATPNQVVAIRQAADESILTSHPANREAFYQADARFHDLIAAAANNVFLQSAVTSLRQYAGQSDLLLFRGDVVGSFEVASEQHQLIAEAIAGGDGEAAARHMNEHIDTVQRQFEKKIQDRLFTAARGSHE